MSASVPALDKYFESHVDADMGKIGIRVVVFQKKTNESASTESDEPLDLEVDEDFSQESDVSTFLESPKKGRLCCVFLINGQRHDGMDNSFIVSELKMKYLRKRMIIVIDLDGLSQKATSEIMQGSRGSFYQGVVYHKIRERIAATLKNDPQLLQLEEEAEEELSQLKAGDAVVQKALDQLIESHFDAGDHSSEGENAGGEKDGQLFDQSGKAVNTKVVTFGEVGVVAQTPALVSPVRARTLRVYPGEQSKLKILSFPETEFSNIKHITAQCTPPIEGLVCALDKKTESAEVSLEFTPKEDFDSADYPLDTDLIITAVFNNALEPRLLEKKVVIKPKTIAPPPPPRPPRPLLDIPTFLRVSSRPPVRLVSGGADTHVRLMWDGKDSLTFEPNPDWSFSASCLSHPGLKPFTFTKPTNGRFEVLVNAPEALLVGTKLEFEVIATGPQAAQLTAKFDAEIVLPAGARIETKEIAVGGQRRPPYTLDFIEESQFQSSATRWGESTWDKTHSACFIEPKGNKPLHLIINSDYGLFKSYQDEQIGKKADENRLNEKKTKYVTHVAYHLYQMYLAKSAIDAGKVSSPGPDTNEEPDVRQPSDEEQQAEINRVASTILRLMEVMR